MNPGAVHTLFFNSKGVSHSTMDKFGNTRMITLSNIPTTLMLFGDVGAVLHAECSWKPASPAFSQTGNVALIKLQEQRIRFGLGAAAFGPSPEHAIQRLGECGVVDSIPWWTPAEKPSTSRCEMGEAEMLTPFLIAWDTLDSALALLDSPMDLPLVKWYEQILEHPSIRKTGAIAVEVVARIPAGIIVDKYMYRAPLAQTNELHKGQMITDPDLIDAYFLRNSVRGSVSLDTVCTVVMVGVVIDPIVVAATWGDDVLRRGFYATPGIIAQANVIHHTHAAVIFDSSLMDGNSHNPLRSIDDDMALAARELASGTRKVSLVHIESDTRLHRAAARIGIIENIELIS